MPTIDGHQVTITNPSKILFPDDGITKGELVEYYERIAGRMLPYVRDRPLHMNRFPAGLGGIAIQQKRVPESFPSWIPRVTVDLHKGGTITHAVIDNAATLVYLANYNMITAHVWLSRVQAPEQPDQLIFDLDPSDDDFNLVRETALTLKGLLDDVHLVPFVKTTGSRGLHVVVPIRATGGFEAAHVFADAVAQRLAVTNPDRVTTEFIKQKREGRLFIDVNRNAYAQTAVAPYAVRARRGAPVSVPIPWSEVERESLRPDSLTIKNLFDYLDDNPDPWQQMEGSRQSLPVLSASDRPDRSGRRRGVARAPGADASS
ncbi:MAG TPA: non-homologous end-joining DNA ligase [Candidatus Dormibacteraeota bacterium]|jgi:bifunctional non-homologous end joining protein LigD